MDESHECFSPLTCVVKYNSYSYFLFEPNLLDWVSSSGCGASALNGDTVRYHCWCGHDAPGILSEEKAQIDGQRAENENQTGLKPNLPSNSLPLTGMDGVPNQDKTPAEETLSKQGDENTNLNKQLPHFVFIELLTCGVPLQSD